MYLIGVCQFCNKIINGFMYYLIILGNDFGIKKEFTRLHFKSVCTYTHPLFKWDLCNDIVI